MSWIIQNYLKYFNHPVSITGFHGCTEPVVAGLSNILSKFKLYKPISISPCIWVAFKSHFKVMQKRYRSYFSAQISTYQHKINIFKLFSIELPPISVICTGSLPCRIDLQGVHCKPYRVWICSVSKYIIIPIVQQPLVSP